MIKPNILIIDDNQDLAEGLCMILQSENYQVMLAFTGYDGIKAFREKSFDIVLIDMKLPDINGIEVFQRIHRHNPDVRVIMMTGYRIEQFLKKVIGNGAVEILHKPFEMERVSEILMSMNNESIILIADDDPDSSLNLTAYLFGQGIKTKLAHNADEAIEYVSSHPVDVLLLDLRSSIMCALEIYLQLKQLGHPVKTVIFSGGNSAEGDKSLDLLQSTLVTGCLFKPFRPEGLLDIISQITEH